MEEGGKLKIGDVVTLKSGGPEMTINEIVEQPLFGEGEKPTKIVGYINCTWFEKSKVMSSKFHIDSLKPVKGTTE